VTDASTLIGGLIVALIAGVLIYAMIVLQPRPQKGKPKRGTRGNINKEDIQAKWSSITAASGAGASGLKNAVNDADKLLDYVMKQQGYGGDTMADRLKQADKKLSRKNDVWRAHKLRNSLAHDIGFDLVPSQAKEALRDFEKALKDLGAL
jgi:hypothetical protein